MKSGSTPITRSTPTPSAEVMKARNVANAVFQARRDQLIELLRSNWPVLGWYTCHTSTLQKMFSGVNTATRKVVEREAHTNKFIRLRIIMRESVNS